MKNLIIVTGGAGFIGSNLIQSLLTVSKFKILSIDNYSTGTKKNHIINKRVIYINNNTKNISKILNKRKKRIHSVFHFGEFSRIYQSFKNLNNCVDSNSTGSFEVFNFCLKNKIKLIYSATSATLGNNGDDTNLSPYAFTKGKNLELLENLKKWYKLNCEIIYFYNVYGPNQILKGSMAAVIGIFEDNYKKNKPLPIVKPGNQSRRFTHISDTIRVCIEAWKKNKSKHYSISHKESYTIKNVAKMFDCKVKFLPPRAGERYASALTDINQSNFIQKRFGKISLKNYIKEFKKTVKLNNK